MTRDEQIQLLLTKGVEQVLPSVDFLRAKLQGNERLTVYCGYDPTAPTLHIGHAITLRKLRHFQDLGHRVIFLIGDFTARAGDPDKLLVRRQITEKEIKANLKAYKSQASRFIRFTGKNAATVKFNNRWLSRLRFSDVISIASLMTVDQMLKRDMFVRRMNEEKPIYIHEFLYPLMQGYDSVAMDVDGEVGGNDQMFNMMAGRTLLKQIKGKEKFVLTTKLLEDSSGKKMGKTEGNMITLEDSPVEIYGKVMSWTDGLIVPGFDLCTDYTPHQVEEIRTALTKGENPRDLKMKLAYEITTSVWGDKEARKAQETFIASFQKGEIPKEIKEVWKKETLKESLLQVEEIGSAAQLRRLVQAGAITFIEEDEKMTIESLEQSPKKGTYRIGKHRFIRIS